MTKLGMTFPRTSTIASSTNPNLLNAKLSGQNTYIDIATIFGGTTIIVPSNWNVKVDILSIFGGFADKREARDTNSADPMLYIKGVTIFGGGEIKSHK